MIDRSKPTIVVSRCLGFDNCRYNGDVIMDKFVERLKPYVNYVTVCPEVEIGLGVPRKAVRLVMEDEVLDIYQPATGKTYTEEMKDHAKDVFKSLEDVHGFILKGRSPTCGIKDVKVYLGKESYKGSIKGEGIFASSVKEEYPYLPIEEEGRLTNYTIREHFLTKLYTFFEFQKVKESNAMKELVKFHSDNKYLLMAYNQNELRILGQIVANHDKKEFNVLIEDYCKHLGLALAELPKRSNFINSFMHIFGYISDSLSKNEKEFILDRFEKYRSEQIHLSVLSNLLNTYVIKNNLEYLLSQTIWITYPEELLNISDTGNNSIN